MKMRGHCRIQPSAAVFQEIRLQNLFSDISFWRASSVKQNILLSFYCELPVENPLKAMFVF
jgi:hypothetical protein